MNFFLSDFNKLAYSLRSQGDNKFEIVYIYHPKINPTTFFEMVHLQSELSSLIFWKIYNLVCLWIPSSKHQVFLRQVPPLHITYYLLLPRFNYCCCCFGKLPESTIKWCRFFNSWGFCFIKFNMLNCSIFRLAFGVRSMQKLVKIVPYTCLIHKSSTTQSINSSIVFGIEKGKESFWRCKHGNTSIHF